MKHYITFNKKYYNESTALEQSVMNYSWGGGGVYAGMCVCVQSVQLEYFNVHVGIYDNIKSRYPEGQVIPILILLLLFHIS